MLYPRKLLFVVTLLMVYAQDDPAQKLLDELRNFFDVTVVSTLVGTDILKEELSPGNIISDFTSNIQEESKVIWDQLSNIKESAIKVGADISTCLFDREEKLQILEETAIDKFIICVESHHKRRQKYLTNIKNNLSNLTTDADELQVKLTNCQADEDCVNKLIEEIKNSTDKIQDFLLESGIQVANHVLGFEKTVSNCEDFLVSQMLDEDKAIIWEIMECAQNIIIAVNN